MKSAMLAMVFVLATAGTVEIPLPPAEEATPSVPQIDDAVVSLGDRAPRVPGTGETSRQIVQLATPRIPVVKQSLVARSDRPLQSPRVATAVAETVKLSFPKPSTVVHGPLDSPSNSVAIAAFLAATEADRRAILAAEQLRYATDRPRRGLPNEFLLGGCVIRGQVPRDEYPRMVWVVQAGRERDARFLDQYPEVRFIVTDERPAAILSLGWLRLIDGERCVAVVLGINPCRWSRPESLAVTAQDLIEKRDYLKNLTDAPILLAVSRVNAQEQVNCRWMKAFAGSTPWDGYAFVGFSTFRGLREMGRSKICREAGVPEDRPAVVFHWHDVATRRGDDEDLARTRQVWQANAGPLVKKLRADDWKGFLMDLFTPEQLWTRMDYLQPEVEKSR